MKILICGASGFIGRHLLRACTAQGWQVACAGRKPGMLALDLNQVDEPSTASAWQEVVRGFDVVINACGILSGSEEDFKRVQTRATLALHAACSAAGVAHFVQISALAPEGLSDLPPFLSSKYAADAGLLAAAGQGACSCLIVRPALLVGVDGASSSALRSIAALPVLPDLRAADGSSPWLQPLKIDDLCRALGAHLQQVQSSLASGEKLPSAILVAAGAQRMSWLQMLVRYRQEMGLAPAPACPLPYRLSLAATSLLRYLPTGRSSTPLPFWRQLASPENLHLLLAGNTASEAQCAPMQTLLGTDHGRRDDASWFAPELRPGLRAQAVVAWGLPLLRLALAFIWLWTALVSVGLFPLGQSLALLAPLQLPHAFNMLLLYGASACDLLLGVATLCYPRRWLWWGQIALIVFYTLIISLFLPDFWLHPFAPVAKNIPILALLLFLLCMEEKK